MAKTGAERQRAYMDRKLKLAQCDGAAEEFRVRFWGAFVDESVERPDLAPRDYLLAMLTDHSGIDVAGPFLAQVLGLSADQNRVGMSKGESLGAA